MATRSLIGIKNKDNSVQSIYCHNDGYLSHNGYILLNRFNTEELVRELISHGDASFLGFNITPSDQPKKCIYKSIGDGLHHHSFYTPHPETCVFYHRDRGEKLETHFFDSPDDFHAADFGAEYYYLFDNGQWFVQGKLLTMEIINGII